MKKKKYGVKRVIIMFAIAVVLMVSLLYATRKISQITGKSVLEINNTEEIAKCLTEKGAKMYGAYWCGHCQNQKKMFGEDFQYVDYVECDSNGENANPQTCYEAGIKGYPTWIINGNQYSGEQSLDKLKELGGC